MLCRHETLSDAILEERGIGLGPVTKRRGGEWEERSTLSTLNPAQTLAARIQDGDLITNSGFFDHPTACVQATCCIAIMIINLDYSKREQNY